MTLADLLAHLGIQDRSASVSLEVEQPGNPGATIHRVITGMRVERDAEGKALRVVLEGRVDVD